MGPTAFLLHHLTDLHLGSLHYAPNRSLGVAPDPTGARNVHLYLDYLRSLPKEALPDVIVISGDLTSLATEKEIDLAHDALDKLLAIGRSKNAAWRSVVKAPFIVMVPGNHDLDWGRQTHPERIERYARLSDNLHSDGMVLSSVYKSQGSVDHVDFGDDVNLFLLLLDSTQLGGTQDPGLIQLHRILSEQYRHSPATVAAAEVKQALDTLEGKARVDPGYVDPSCLARLEQNTRQVPAHRIKIAVVHHNLVSVPSDDIDAFDIVVNAGIVKQSLVRAGFDVVLSGHRHIYHCSQELHVGGTAQHRHNIVFVSGDSLGCKVEAPFVMVRLTDATHAHRGEPPAALLDVANYRHVAGGYAKDTTSVFETAISRQLDDLTRAVKANVGRSKDELATGRSELLEALRIMLPAMQQLQSEMVDWSASTRWIGQFHFQLDAYHCIYATDVYKRFSIENPHYEKYLQEQYMVRLRRLLADGSRKLAFSPAVYDAILRTGWKPSPVLWNEHDVVLGSESATNQLEIVRVLVRPADTERERQVLATLDFEHRLFAIPLLVIDPSHLPPAARVDFALGFGHDGKLVRCYEYSEAAGSVEERDHTRGDTLRNIFESMLRKPQLLTISQFLGRSDMIPDPIQLQEFANSYDESRRASPQIVNVLRKHFPADRMRAGVDIGCGTGNYTVPFTADFETLIGVDASMEMLSVAKRKSSSIRWIRANAMHTELENESCDAIWLISTLHYFEGERQRRLFAELRRILRTGGVLIADTEFAEQHESLWLKHFFPSLRDRYKHAIQATSTYTKWLTPLGFASVEFETIEYKPEEKDAFLRIGQRKPELYLEPAVRAGIPAFLTMNTEERQAGLKKLGKAIDDGSINQIITEYEGRATMPGDVGFIVARR